MGVCGWNQREFENETTLREGDDVEYQMGIDSPRRSGKIEYDWVGWGMFIANLREKSGKRIILHWETSYGDWNRKPVALMIWHRGKRIV